MNARQRGIIELLARLGELSVASTATHFAVTQATIRRDLQLLEDQGLLQRSHGAAIPSPQSSSQFSFARKSHENETQKRAIGRAVACEVKPHMVVSLDTGTTTLEAARAIVNVSDIKVITTSLPIAAALHTQDHLEVILMGGVVRRNDPDLSGALTEENLRRFRADVAVMGADAVGPDGVYTGDMATARGAQAMLAGARRRILVADSSKFARRGLFRYAQWKEFAAIYVDAAAPREVRRWLAKAGPELHYVGVEGR